jgi:hypothetical protein
MTGENKDRNPQPPEFAAHQSGMRLTATHHRIVRIGKETYPPFANFATSVQILHLGSDYAGLGS